MIPTEEQVKLMTDPDWMPSDEEVAKWGWNANAIRFCGVWATHKAHGWCYGARTETLTADPGGNTDWPRATEES